MAQAPNFFGPGAKICKICVLLGRVGWAVFGYLTIHMPILAPFNFSAKKKKTQKMKKKKRK